MRDWSIARGDIIKVDFGKPIGSVQGGIRPALVIQNNIGNRFSPTTIVVSLTTQSKKEIATHYKLSKDTYKFLTEDSIVLAEQIMTISEKQIKKKIGSINQKDLEKVNEKILISVGLNNIFCFS